MASSTNKTYTTPRKPKVSGGAKVAPIGSTYERGEGGGGLPQVSTPLTPTPTPTPTPTTPTTPTKKKKGKLPEGFEDTKALAEEGLSAVTEQEGMSPTSAEIEKLKYNEGQFIDPNTGKITDQSYIKEMEAQQGEAAQGQTPGQIDTTLAKTYTTGEQTDKALNKVDAVEGEVSKDATMTGVTANPDKMSQLDLKAAQLKKSQEVEDIAARKLKAGETVAGAVDMKQANALADQTANSAVTADPSKQATVQGQMDELMKDFEGGKTPAWAAGAIRNANAQMAARGLSSSSIAGQAILQAAMESAVPIASQDAQTYATFEQQNLSNKQQAVMAAAEQRATFLGQKFDQKFQARVYNASKVTEIANKNYDTSVQVALENAKMAQTVDLANLDAKNAKVLADAAAMTQMDLTNLSNRQQAQVQNAQAFLQMDLANADRAQQTELFKAQARMQSLLSDAAAKNATEQFNAKSENETEQFMASLASSMEQFNVAQQNAMTQTNLSEENKMIQARAELQAERLAFNANNQLVIAQSNTEWRRQVSETNTAALNEANLLDAQNATTMTLAEFNAEAQGRRDMMSYLFTSVESEKDRAAEILISQIASKANAKSGAYEALGGVLPYVAKWLLD